MMTQSSDTDLTGMVLALRTLRLFSRARSRTYATSRPLSSGFLSALPDLLFMIPGMTMYRTRTSVKTAGGS